MYIKQKSLAQAEQKLEQIELNDLFHLTGLEICKETRISLQDQCRAGIMGEQ